jgi:hypothetical protein
MISGNGARQSVALTTKVFSLAKNRRIRGRTRIIAQGVLLNIAAARESAVQLSAAAADAIAGHFLTGL